jgi:hypothetical protein
MLKTSYWVGVIQENVDSRWHLESGLFACIFKLYAPAKAYCAI